jgi:hypothetical protein
MLNNSSSKYCFVLSLNIYTFYAFEVIVYFYYGHFVKFWETNTLHFSHSKLNPISVMVSEVPNYHKN